jgi:hypothetical protein
MKVHVLQINCKCNLLAPNKTNRAASADIACLVQHYSFQNKMEYFSTNNNLNGTAASICWRMTGGDNNMLIHRYITTI